MWFLYLDESGDLGFDFISKKPSKFFTVTVLAINSPEHHKAILGAVRKTLKRKIIPNKKDRSTTPELKGSSMTMEQRRYFYAQVRYLNFEIYSVTLNKKQVFKNMMSMEKDRLYNFVSRLVLDQIPFETAEQRVHLYIDKSKGAIGIKEFNAYIQSNLRGRLNPLVPLDIYHRQSCNTPGLQAVDVFCNGIFKKHEHADNEWFEIFREKIKYEELSLK